MGKRIGVEPALYLVEDVPRTGHAWQVEARPRTEQVPHVLLRVGDRRAGDHKHRVRAVLALAQSPQPPQHQRRMAPKNAPARPQH